jgi:hypothetical protein
MPPGAPPRRRSIRFNHAYVALIGSLLAGLLGILGLVAARHVDTRTQRSPEVLQPPAALAVGLNAHPLYSDADAWPGIARTMGQGGLDWVRMDVNWSSLAPNSAGFDPQFVKRITTAIMLARGAGLKVLVTFLSTPAWANRGAGFDVPPANPSAYGHAIGALAALMRGQVAAYEVWNEPNLVRQWIDKPASYVTLLRAAASAVRSNDAGAMVVLGGLSTNDDKWLSHVYAAGAKGSFDAVAVHPYPYPSDSGPDGQDNGHSTFTHLAEIRNVMLDNQDTRPVWITELGWSTHTNQPSTKPDQLGVDNPTQAANVTAVGRLLASRFPFVTTLIWYEARDEAGLGPQEDNFGVLHLDLSPKPAFASLQNLSPHLRPARNFLNGGIPSGAALKCPPLAPRHRTTTSARRSGSVGAS